jgi:hypothetical protein
VRRVGFFSDGRIAKTLARRSRTLLSLAALAATVPALIGCVATPNGNTGAATPAGPELQVTPSNINFTAAVVGVQTSQTLKLTNDGGSALTVTGVVASGTGLSVSGFSGSTLLSPGTSSNLTVLLTPKAAGAFTGSVAIMTSTASVGASLPVTAEATTANKALTAGPTSVSFGTVASGKAASKTLTLTNTGNAEVNVTKVTVSGVGFTMTGWSSPVKLESTQSLTLDVMFDSTATGNHTGTLTVASTASASITVPLSGAIGPEAPDAQHSVGLSWDASTSPSISGYNVYRGGSQSGPFTRLNGSLVSGLAYTDGTVASGDTYYYVTTAVDAHGDESPHSNWAKAVIP